MPESSVLCGFGSKFPPLKPLLESQSTFSGIRQDILGWFVPPKCLKIKRKVIISHYTHFHQCNLHNSTSQLGDRQAV